MPEPTPMPRYRLARREDIPALIARFGQLAPDIPVRDVPTDLIEKCAISGNSIVSLIDPSREIIGFILADRVRQVGANRIALHYGGVIAGRRGQGVFSMMIGQLQRRGSPLFGNVHANNKFDVGRRLLRLGFEHLGRTPPLPFDAYRWPPSS